MCPVNSQNDEKLDYAFSLANTCMVAHSTRRNFCLQAVDVQQFIRCQIARSILYCSIIIVGPSEEAKSQVQGSHEYKLLNLPKRQRAKRKVL